MLGLIVQYSRSASGDTTNWPRIASHRMLPARIASAGGMAADPRFRRAYITGRPARRTKVTTPGVRLPARGASVTMVHWLEGVHFGPPEIRPAAISSIFDISVIATPLDPAGGLNVNASGSGAAPVFQCLSRKVYCGAAATALLVITYLRALAELYPDLPICVEVSEREMLALDPIHETPPIYLASSTTLADLVHGRRARSSGGSEGSAPVVDARA
jgi:hypothetical protein